MSDVIDLKLRQLRLPAFLNYYQEVAIEADRSGWSFVEFLNRICEIELSERNQRKLDRYRKQSGLPQSKTFSTLELKRFSKVSQRQIATICEGGFVEKGHNVLAFGLPGRGKTHLLCAIGNHLVNSGVRTLFVPAYKLVQRLLAAKEKLRLEKELKKLDTYDVVIVDDIGYIQQNRDEMEVLFTFLAERYERKSVMISSNLVFSQWDRIFKDPMTTAAAIDRLVHHATILELTGGSFRTENAKLRKQNDNYNDTKKKASEEKKRQQSSEVGVNL